MFIYPGGKGFSEENPAKAVQVSRGEIVMLVEYFKTQIPMRICQQYNLIGHHTISTLEVDLPGFRILRDSNLLEATCRFPTGGFISFFLIVHVLFFGGRRRITGVCAGIFVLLISMGYQVSAINWTTVGPI